MYYILSIGFMYKLKNKNKNIDAGVPVAHTCNPSCSGGSQFEASLDK
jgi:hypothetical protein